MVVKKISLKWFLLIFALAGLSSAADLLSQYILDEEEKMIEEKVIIKKEKKNDLEPKKIVIEPKKKIIKQKKEVAAKKDSLPISADAVDRILKKTFFKGYYIAALKELQNIAGSSDNKIEVSKANLFIARSYIELGDYRKALEILISSDAKKYFPNDVNFWEEFALMRIKNY